MTDWKPALYPALSVRVTHVSTGLSVLFDSARFMNTGDRFLDGQGSICQVLHFLG
jgi:hypothetical protein